MEKTVILLAMVAAAALCCVGEAAVHIVGDSAGWTLKNAPNYTAWSLSQDFHVGDVLVFQYNHQYHNVMEVSKDDYLNCNESSPIATYSTGNDTVTLDRRSHYFFICGFQGHCEAGQKFYVMTPKPASDAPSPASPPASPAPPVPSPAPSVPSPAPPAPSTAPPAPSKAPHAPSTAPPAPSTPPAEPAPAPAAPSASSPPPSAGGSTGTTPAATPAPPKPSAATTTIHNALGFVAVFAAVSAGFLMH